jgi:desulfoferrodoxin (superoxide reductase-like protein)
MKKLVFSFLALFCFFLTGALANKTSVEVNAPAEVKKGTEVKITVEVMHKGNSKTHHTEWVTIKINGQEVKRWSYTKELLPPGDQFTLEFTYVADEPLTVEVAGNCNIHGSTGSKTVVVQTVN